MTLANNIIIIIKQCCNSPHLQPFTHSITCKQGAIWRRFKELKTHFCHIDSGFLDMDHFYVMHHWKLSVCAVNPNILHEWQKKPFKIKLMSNYWLFKYGTALQFSSIYFAEFINTAVLQMLTLLSKTYFCTYETTWGFWKCPYKHSGLATWNL